MKAKEIIFSIDRHASMVTLQEEADIQAGVAALEIPVPTPTIVWIGGAGSVTEEFVAPARQAAIRVAQAARQAGAVVVDGATDSGVMAAMGRIHSLGDHTFPLVGVVAKDLVAWWNVPAQKGSILPTFAKKLIRYPFTGGKAGEPWILNPYHTHFLLVPGSRWGAESSWIADIATHIAGDQPSITVLVNGRSGGGICAQDVENSLRVGRRVLVLTGTGGWADELAAEPPPSDMWQFIPFNEKKAVVEALGEHLAGGS